MLKPKIAITQRTNIREGQSQVYDSLDQNWTLFLYKCNFFPVLIPNLAIDFEEYLINISGVILTGGGDFSRKLYNLEKDKNFIEDPNLVSEDRDNLELNLIKYCAKNKIPLLGVCRGMQMLNYFYGGNLKKVEGHCGQNQNLKILKDQFKFDNIVNSYHELAVTFDNIGNDLIPLASTKKVIKSLLHNKNKQLGIMWHPERNKPFSKNDILLFKNFFKK